jgi:hypothetical protein
MIQPAMAADNPTTDLHRDVELAGSSIVIPPATISITVICLGDGRC